MPYVHMHHMWVSAAHELELDAVEGEGAFSLQPVYVLAAASALLPNTPEPHLTNLPLPQSINQLIKESKNIFMSGPSSSPWSVDGGHL